MSSQSKKRHPDDPYSLRPSWGHFLSLFPSPVPGRPTTVRNFPHFPTVSTPGRYGSSLVRRTTDSTGPGKWRTPGWTLGRMTPTRPGTDRGRRRGGSDRSFRVQERKERATPPSLTTSDPHAQTHSPPITTLRPLSADLSRLRWVDPPDSGRVEEGLRVGVTTATLGELDYHGCAPVYVRRVAGAGVAQYIGAQSVSWRNRNTKV